MRNTKKLGGGPPVLEPPPSYRDKREGTEEQLGPPPRTLGVLKERGSLLKFNESLLKFNESLLRFVLNNPLSSFPIR